MNARARVGAAGLVLAVLAACEGPPGAPTTGSAVPSAAPPRPPAACLVDAAALAAQTGVTWTPDQTTASDTRCVYDAGSGPDGPVFLAVTLGALTEADPAAEIEMLAQLCDRDSRAPIDAGDGGVICRFGRGQVFGALVRGSQVVTVTVSAVPAATTGAQLVVAVDGQLSRL